MQKRLGRVAIVCAMEALSLLGCASAGARPREAFDNQLMRAQSTAAPAPAMEEAAYADEDAIQSAALPSAAARVRIVDRIVEEDTDGAVDGSAADGADSKPAAGDGAKSPDEAAQPPADPALAAAETHRKLSPWIFAAAQWRVDQLIADKADFFETQEAAQE